MNSSRVLGLYTLTIALFFVTTASCGSGGSSTTIGFFPAEMLGNVTDLVGPGCGALGINEDDAVLFDLTGNRIVVDVDVGFDLDCEGTIYGEGDILFAGETDPRVQGMEFSIRGEDECGDLDDLDYTNLKRVRVVFDTVPPDPAVLCTDETDDPLGDRLECEIESCRFNVLDPFIVYLFDLEEALDEAIDDAVYY